MADIPQGLDRLANVMTLQRWPREMVKELPILTPWQVTDQGTLRQPTNPDDIERDLRYRALVMESIAQHACWLVPLLRAAGAPIAATPGRLFFSLLEHPLVWLEVKIPALSEALKTLPWPEDGEAVH